MKYRLDKKLLKSLAMMAAVVEARDAYTGGHLWRVSQYCRLLAEKMGLSAKAAFHVTLGGFLHDLGKVGVPDAILGKKGELTDGEYEVIKTHPIIGEALVNSHPLGDLAADAIRHHHEWYDGQGYPDGLHKEAISLNARIISIADAFDAMTSTRPYRVGMPVEAAMADLKAYEERQFDGALLERFFALSRDDALRHIVGHSDHGVRLVNCPVCGPVIAVSRTVSDGDIIHCRICRNALQLHRSGDTFQASPTGGTASAAQVMPTADMGPIADLVTNAPRSLTL